MEKHRPNEILAIPINATNDVNPFQKIEFKDSLGEIHLLDSFEVFFQNPKSARNNYIEMFRSIRSRLDKENDTKLSVKSHSTNIDEIRGRKTADFKIIVALDASSPIKFNIGTLNNGDMVEERLKQLGICEIGNMEQYGLGGMVDGDNVTDGYKNLFNVGFGGGTHNIASSIKAFQKIRKRESCKSVAPSDIDEGADYAMRTSLFCEVDGEKVCLRTDADMEKITNVTNAINAIKHGIDHVLVTDHDLQDFGELRKHSVPTKFSKNVFHSVLTVVFNCEDREAGEVINAVISDLTNLLENESFPIGKKTTLEESLEDLIDLKKQLDEANVNIDLIKVRIKDKKDYVELMHKKGRCEGFEIEGENNKLQTLIKNENGISNTRVKLLQKILVKLMEITNLTQVEKTEGMPANNELQRVSLITNGDQGSVGFIEIHNRAIFFTNGILQDEEKEQRLFKTLTKLSEGAIDMDVRDTTGCGDSSTAAALMIRESDGRKERETRYINVLNELGIDKNQFGVAIGITEAYFLSKFQKVISGVVYHCKKSNLGDIPNSDKIAKIILGFVFDETLLFLEHGMKKFLYGDNLSERENRNYNGFNIYRILNGTDLNK